MESQSGPTRLVNVFDSKFRTNANWFIVDLRSNNFTDRVRPNSKIEVHSTNYRLVNAFLRYTEKCATYGRRKQSGCLPGRT